MIQLGCMKIRNVKVFCAVSLFFISIFYSNRYLNAQEARFVSNLKLGSYGEEVVFLQQLLNSDSETIVAESGAGSPQNETPTFGPRTQMAVIKFQEKHREEILAPLGLVTGTGIVGSNTRAVLNRLVSGVSNSPVSSTVTNSWENSNIYPTISAVIPGIVSDPRNTQVTIVGENFTSKNTVFLSVQDLEIFDGYSSDGKTITLTLNTAFIDIIKGMVDGSGDALVRQSAVDALKVEFDSVGRDGVYLPATIFVKNEKGESNKFLIHINVLKDEE